MIIAVFTSASVQLRTIGII